MNKVDLIGLLSSGAMEGTQKIGKKEEQEYNFTEIISEKLDNLNDLQIKADESTEQLIMGEADNIHEVLINNEEAMLALELTMQVRNKIVEAYQEIMRMQI